MQERTRRRYAAAAAAAALVLAAVAAGCGGGASSSGSTATSPPRASGSLTGAGSTLVAPLVGAWASDYQSKHGVNVSYSAIGSGGGIASITSKTVDFAGSDAPLTPDQRANAGDVVQLPWALAATLVAVNVPGVSGHLKLTGPVVADIYLGKITNWDDPAVAKLNPGTKLPDQKITPIYRSDGSGDTYAFTDYLSHVSQTWKSKVGTSTSVSWPTGLGAKGNSGMAAALEQTKGGIAYVAIAQVLQSGLSYALLQNAAGNYPDPGPGTISAAAATASFDRHHAASIVAPPASAKQAYPISTFTYVLVRPHGPKSAALKRFLTYAVGPGQQFATKLDFAPLPAQVVAVDKQAIEGL
jgi:phosphate transport system substrate-binding protein